MSRLVTKDSKDKSALKPQMYKSRSSYTQGQKGNYNQRNYQNRDRSSSRDREQYSRKMIDPDSNKIIEEMNLGKTPGDTELKTAVENIETIGIANIIEAEIDLEKGHFKKL